MRSSYTVKLLGVRFVQDGVCIQTLVLQLVRSKQLVMLFIGISLQKTVKLFSRNSYFRISETYVLLKLKTIFKLDSKKSTCFFGFFLRYVYLHVRR